MKIALCVIQLFFSAIVCFAETPSLRFPEWIMPSVVVIGEKGANGAWRAIGTGFLMYGYDNRLDFLITNRHVLKGRKEILVKASLRDSISGIALEPQYRWAEFRITLQKADTLLWVAHPDSNIDIAATYFPPPDMRHIMLSMVSDITRIPKSLSASFSEIDLAQEVLFFGFPLGLGSMENPRPVVRNGIVAYLAENGTIVLDAESFGGSSGSPVFTTGRSLGDPPRIPERRLIGVNGGHLTSRLVASAIAPDSDPISADSVFTENAGLAIVYSADLIYETIDQLNMKLGQRFKNALEALLH